MGNISTFGSLTDFKIYCLLIKGSDHGIYKTQKWYLPIYSNLIKHVSVIQRLIYGIRITFYNLVA